VIAAFAVEAVHWQIVYHRNGPGRLATFDAQAPSIVDDAFRHAGTVYAFRFDHPQYIDLLLYSALEGRSRSSAVILDSTERPPVGAVFIGRVDECPQCRQLAAKDNFVTYRYKPAAPGVLRTHFQLNSPLLPVGSPLQLLVEVDNNGSKPADHIVLTVKLPGSLRIAAPPYHQRGSCSTHSKGILYEPTASTTITCNMGYFPRKSSTIIRYQVVVARGGPQTMTAKISSDQLDVNPVGTGSAFTVDLSPPSYARSSK
jgi:Domain of unknown function DUF11